MAERRRGEVERGHKIERVHDAVHARGVVHAGCAVALVLQIAVVAQAEVHESADGGGGIGRVDEAARGVELLVGEVVFLPGERSRERHLIK